MSEDSPLDYLQKEVFPGMEDLEADLRGAFGPRELEQYGVESGDELLTEDAEELRSYEIGYEGFDFGMSVELGTFEGRRSIGISAGTSVIQDEVADLVSDIADAYDSWARPLGQGDYILDIEDW